MMFMKTIFFWKLVLILNGIFSGNIFLYISISFVAPLTPNVGFSDNNSIKNLHK